MRIFVNNAAVKRVPYADHILVLDSNGCAAEQGSFNSLDSAGGYISSFNLSLPDWSYKGGLLPAPDVQVKTVEKVDEAEKETHEKGGDVSIYLYYVRAIGWLPTMVFLVAMLSFVFCLSFPSRPPAGYHLHSHLLIPKQVSG